MKELAQNVSSAWSKSNALYAKTATMINMNYSEMMVLYALKTEGDLTQKQIAENFGMQKQTVNGIVKKMTAKALVSLSHSTADKREKLVMLTDSGSAYAESKLKLLFDTEKKVYGIIGEDKMKLLYETLDLFNLLFERELDGGKERE